jgi:hypothetical protein
MQIHARLLLAADAAPRRVIADRTDVAIVGHQHFLFVLHGVDRLLKKRMSLPRISGAAAAEEAANAGIASANAHIAMMIRMFFILIAGWDFEPRPHVKT